MVPEDIVNQALDSIGYPRSIGDIAEGTRAARVAQRAYSETRDEMLRIKDWPFARRSLTLNLLKQAGNPPYNGGVWTSAFPPPPFAFEYLYPLDCLYLRYVRPSPTASPVLDPLPVLFTVANDSSVINNDGQATKVILTNQDAAIGVYTGQILDINTWEPLFVMAVVEGLAKKFTVALAQSPDLLKDKVQESGLAIEIAGSREG